MILLSSIVSIIIAWRLPDSLPNAYFASFLVYPLLLLVYQLQESLALGYPFRFAFMFNEAQFRFPCN